MEPAHAFNSFTLENAQQVLDDITPLDAPPGDLDELSPRLAPTIGPASLYTTPPGHLLPLEEELSSALTPFIPMVAPNTVPALRLPSTIAQPLAPYPVSTITPSQPRRLGRNRRNKRRGDEKLPHEWEGVEMEDVDCDVPDQVVKVLYNRLMERAERSAWDKKIEFRERLKEMADKESGTMAEISSRREAKVSRMFQVSLKKEMEEEMKRLLKRYAALWKTSETQRLIEFSSKRIKTE